jgi:hypothetical protein
MTAFYFARRSQSTSLALALPAKFNWRRLAWANALKESNLDFTLMGRL